MKSRFLPFFRPPVLGQHRQVGQDERQFPVAGLVEGERDLALVVGHRARHVAEILRVLRRMFLQLFQRPHHVVRRDRYPVVPAGVLVQPVGGGGIVVGIGEVLGNQRVGGGRFVHGLRHQVVPQQPALIVQPRRRCALHDERVEAVERAVGRLVQSAAFRRIGVHMIVVGERPPVIFRRADERRRGAPLRLLRRNGSEGQQGGGSGEGNEFQHAGSPDRNGTNCRKCLESNATRQVNEVSLRLRQATRASSSDTRGRPDRLTGRRARLRGPPRCPLRVRPQGRQQAPPLARRQAR